MIARPQLLGISGSLRRGSFCTAILRTAAEQIAEEADLEVISLQNVPFYNADLDGSEPPPSVSVLQSAIGRSAGLVIVTPEYNYGLPGVLKNALDWASRPYGRSTLATKPVLTVSASPASTGAVRAHCQLTQSLLAIGARLVPRSQITIGLAHERVVDDRLVDARALRYLADGLSDLVQIARRRDPSADCDLVP